MPRSNSITERLRWKVALGLVVLAAGFGSQAASSADPATNVARSSWGAVEADMARSSWGVAETDVARSSWGATEVEAA
ncbi:MAG TPA: hypothetical protein VKA89_06975 [Solirubrobacterales bacterium]|nr:hypothetical protein [Solirubrobacterales bacterium]